jgi:hypothetical protein
VGSLHPETPVQPSSADRFLTPDDRRREVAAILATGLLRLSACATLAADSGEHSAAENLAGCRPTCLEVPDETVLSVPAD